MPQARVIGAKPRSRGVVAPSTLKIDPEIFQPSPMSRIEAEQKVPHMKFGEGKVERIDGKNDKKVATINFHEIDQPERRIMLKFAKLQILD